MAQVLTHRRRNVNGSVGVKKNKAQLEKTFARTFGKRRQVGGVHGPACGLRILARAFFSRRWSKITLEAESRAEPRREQQNGTEREESGK